MSTPIAHRLSRGERVAGRVRVSHAETSFPELVWAHFLWQQEVHERGIVHGEAEREFRAALRGFERSHGKIQNAYWCTREGSGVALTAQRPYGVLGTTLRLTPIVKFHAATHWVTRDMPEVAGLLHRCEAMSVKFTELLRHGTQQIAMEWLLAISGHLLGFADQSTPSTEAQTKAMVESTKQELAQLEAYYQRAGDETGRIVYFWGMMIGIAALGVVALAGAGLLYRIDALDWHAATTQNLFASYAMGSLGAVVSVLSRMTSGRQGQFYVDFEVGRPPIRRLACFRPFLGAVFALVLYFALLANLVQLGAENGQQEPLEYYAVLSFFAGFSERWVRGVLAPVQLLAGGDTATSAPAPPPSPAPAPEPTLKEA
jgi:hypothetical protein